MRLGVLHNSKIISLSKFIYYNIGWMYNKQCTRIK